MQNIERGEVRECFIAGEGNALIVADYSQIELRIAAAIAPEPAMIAAYNAGTDLHLQTACVVLKKSQDDISTEERRLAKALNFGLLYGQTAKGLVRYLKSDFGISISEGDASRFMSRFFGAYSGLKAWQQKCKRLANNPAIRDVRTAFGRRRLLPRGENQFWPRYTSALNMPIQGGCNDGLKRAMLQLSKVLPGRAQIVSTVHDELIVEAPVEQADAVKTIVEDEMIRAMEQLYPTVPIEVEAKIRETWS
jgi:DNA polymerase-1